jgi:dTDP-4-dehydrorhamnose reductase
MNRILVLGKTGQLAQVLEKVSKSYEAEFQFLSRSELDLTNPKSIENLFEKYPCDFCINTIAYTNVDQAETEEGEKINKIVNDTSLKQLSQEALKHEVSFIHISTDYAINPINNYGQSKLDGENKIIANNPNSIVIRTSWLYSNCGKNFYLTMLKLTKEKESLKVIVDQIGTPTNAYDLAVCLLDITNPGKQFFENKVALLSKKQRVFAFSNSGATSWYDFACSINLLAGNCCKIEPISTSEYPTLAKRPKNSILDSSSLQNTFGIKKPDWWFESLKNLHKSVK